MTSLKDIAGWFERGRENGMSHMIVVCDTFDHDDYPLYASGAEDCWAKYESHNGQNMQRVMEVYDLGKSWASQMSGRTWNLPERPKVSG